MGDLTEHFSRREFRCHDGSEHLIDDRLLEMLENIRDQFCSQVRITSGYRSPSYNAKIGGAKHSFHIRGMAADIQVVGFAPSVVYAWIDKECPECGLGLYPGWVHVDCRGYRARWGHA